MVYMKIETCNTKSQYYASLLHNLLVALSSLFFILPLHANTMQYEKINLKDSEIKAMGVGIFTIKNTSSERGVAFSAVVDFDDKDGYTQNSSLEVVVVNLYKRAGENVKKGEPIAEISSNALSELYFSLQNTYSRFQIAQEVERKDKELLRQGVISQRAYQTSYLTMNELRLKMNEIRASFNIFGINPDNPRGQYGFLVRASGSGKLSVVPTQIGQKIPAFTPYIRIAKPDNDNVLLRIRVPQSRLRSVQQGFSVFNDRGDKIGIIESISSVIDKQTNTISAVARVEAKSFRVGEIVEIYVAGSVGGEAVILPDDCWIKYGDDYLAFLQVANGFQPVPITILEERDGAAVVQGGGLKVGTKVAKGSLVLLKGVMAGLGEDGSDSYGH
ncbi:efflux RND transporter periplasmic adaptor subunit [Helicobacter trogontum]|uniref:efflux RND transporter periplasmic adaptor subunit n=1 Tax=Helicobacter trogontum TaxID=50960 RepID=UPI0024322EE1|nr:efflux RND transporter periplasmic adaptor subunit [Helicobacter trogontum]MCI5787636.1 efflux RND transporter periplasmic adaptor subunit [Helicobacter trogontum]MDY5185238.1 efflux RND transporter periplasmic adaptor subunit [Helicobacter trogontum]